MKGRGSLEARITCKKEDGYTYITDHTSAFNQFLKDAFQHKKGNINTPETGQDLG